MRRKQKPLLNFILAVSLMTAFVSSETWRPMTVKASSEAEIRQRIEEEQRQIAEIFDQITGLEDEQDLLQEEIDDLNAEIQNTMTSIGMKEDEIAAKEQEISDKEGEIVQKQGQIEETKKEYEAAVEREESQRENMAACTRLIYETGESSFWNALLEGKGFADVLNRMDYIGKLYDYEQTLLLAYIDTKNQVHDLWNRLEEEEAGLEADKEQLEAHRQQLKADWEELDGQKASLNAMIEKKKQESANFEAEIARARQAAAVAKKQLQKDQQSLSQLEAAKKAASITVPTTNYSTVVNSAGGSELGKKIANFALQYVGNPYVMGGTSLTGGADCSGFTYRVYSEFGYTLPRTSSQQRNAGAGVNYADAQPGDLICYEGHVGMYIGNGMIVHASNSKPYPSGGIKVSRAEYRTILAVRRIVN